MHSLMKKMWIYVVLGSTLAYTSFVSAGFSPVTHASSDDPRPDPGADSSKWYYYHQLTPLLKYEVADPTYSLEDDTSWPSQQEEFSDTLYPVLR